MNKRTRLLCLTGSWLVLAVFLTGSISDYNFRKPKWPITDPSRRRWLKGMPTPEVKKVMKKMAGDIGVKCVYCHNESDYTSEEKETKEFARTKMGLVQWLNDKYRPTGATWEYSCYTCHHGKVKPVPSAPAGMPTMAPPPGKH